MVKTFKEFLKSLNESPTEIGVVDSGSYSKEDVYDSYKQHNIEFNIISNNVGNGKYILKEYNQTLYLVSATTDEYLGNIQYLKDADRFFIKTSDSKIEGFYGMVFTHIFLDMDFKYIFGDSTQSTRARKAWAKIIKSFDGVVLNTATNEITPYDESKADEYWGQDKKYLRIGITDDKSIIQENFLFVYKRIEEDFAGFYKKMNENKDRTLDMHFYPCCRMHL